MKNVSRRDFLKASALAGFIATPLSSFAKEEKVQQILPERITTMNTTIRGTSPVAPKFPDVNGYKALLGDFHQHTVISDGDLWPTARIEEAKREGLDMVCLSDHIEYRPNRSELTTDDVGRAYHIAKPRADAENIILIPGLEITRGDSSGAKHLNALFLKDFNALVTEKFENAVYAAADQGAYIFWNHPAWGQPSKKSTWHKEMDLFLEKKILRGFEIVNGFEGDDRDYQPDVMEWCQKHKLAMFGNSDAHKASAYCTRWNNFEHRPMTIIFAKERNFDSVKEAFYADRTAVYYYCPRENRDLLIGNQEWIQPLFENGVRWERCVMDGKPSAIITNTLPFTVELDIVERKNVTVATRLFILPGKNTITTVASGECRLLCKVLNADIAKNQKLELEIKF